MQEIENYELIILIILNARFIGHHDLLHLYCFFPNHLNCFKQTNRKSMSNRIRYNSIG